MPMKVEYFDDKRVHSVACGEKFTVVVTIDKKDLPLAYKEQKAEEHDEKSHLSNALKKKI